MKTHICVLPLIAPGPFTSTLQRQITTLFVGIFLLAATLCAEQKDSKHTVKLLTIGNSFANDSLRYLSDIAQSGDKELIVFRANLSGASMERHTGHLTAFLSDPTDENGRPYKGTSDPITGEERKLSLVEALQSDTWDYVTIQQVSHQSFLPDSYEPHASMLIETIKTHAPQAEILIHQTWAYREDHPFFNRGDGFTPLQMYERSRAAYHTLAKRYQLRIIPVGDAFHAARQLPRWTFTPDPTFDYENPPEGALPDQSTSINIGWLWRKAHTTGELVFNLDAIHANVVGCYLGGLVFYEVLFDDSALNIKYAPRELEEEDSKTLRRIAHEQVKALAESTTENP